MCRRTVFCFFILIGLTINVQTVNADISGKVSNQAGKGIADAICTLVVKGTKATTGSDGSYALATTGVTKFRLLQPQSTAITLNGDFIDFSLSDPSPVKVEIFDLKGTLLKRELLQDAQTGFYRFNIAENFRTTKLLVIRASIGRDVMTFRYLPLVNGMANSSVESSVTVNGKLAKITAVIDTLKVTADNYTAKALVITSYDTTVNITLDTAGGSPVTVRLDQTGQTIEGFGINNNWKPLDNTAIKALFDSTTGLGLSVLRIGMQSDGNLTSSNNWNEIKNAKAAGCKYVIGTLWSPPAGWKSGQNGGPNSENGGGHLKKEYYDQWASRIAAFPAKVKQGSGVDLYAMSPQNEPDFASCGNNEPCSGDYGTTLFTAEEMVELIKAVGPKLHAAGCKVIAPEASEWIHNWSDSSACCTENSNLPSSDPLECNCFPGKTTPCKCAPGEGYDYGHYLYKDKTAWAQLDIMGVHQYDTQIAKPWPDDVPDRKPVWQTEMCGTKWWPEQGPSSDINNGVAVAGWIHNALTVGEANVWCWWWWKASSPGNSGLLASDGSDTKRHYTFGNFSRFVRPGFTRVEITGAVHEDVLLSAYKGSGDRLVVVAINKGSASATVPIVIAGGTAPASLTPWVTSANDDLKSKTAVAVSGGTFTAELAGKTVTTFVGK
ncbi:MAG: hypothetical protein JW913_03315 [Chitinispirillaceae bacterium]|nr:hypothetical protein [Chitinispirillaceae bacterium]